MEGYQLGRERGEWGVRAGSKKQKLVGPNRQGDVKNSLGNFFYHLLFLM